MPRELLIMARILKVVKEMPFSINRNSLKATTLQILQIGV
jgi:hypothetical protein